MSSATENQAQKRAYAIENGDDAVDAKSRKVENGQEMHESVFNMITTPEIICDLFSFLDKDQIERIQLVSQFWNNVIIRHKNILPLRQFRLLEFNLNQIYLYATADDRRKSLVSYIINFDGINLSKIEGNVASRYSGPLGGYREVNIKKEHYSQLTVDEVLTNLNDVVFYVIRIGYIKAGLDLLSILKLVTAKTGGRFRGRFGRFIVGRFGSKLVEIFDNYIIVDDLTLEYYCMADFFIREVCANLEIAQLPLTPKEIRLERLEFEKNEEVLNMHFTCNGKLNGANRLTIDLMGSIKYSKFIRQWFELYHTHENPISLVGKFELSICGNFANRVLDAVKTLLNNAQLRVKYSLEEFHRTFRGVTYSVTYQYVKRRCVLHETDSYALVIEMVYMREEIDMSSINASDLDQPPCKQLETISLCVKSL